MGYTVVKSFERGLDTRRMIDLLEPGGLLVGKDCHVTRGGEIEKRAAFVVTATLPATTIGFYAQDKATGPVFHTWGDAASAPAGMPAGAVYHSIPDPRTTTAPNALQTILSVEEFAGKLFVIARYANNQTISWYDDIPVPVYEDPEATPPATPPAGGTGGVIAFATFRYQHIMETLPTGEVEPKETKISRAWLQKPGAAGIFSGPSQDSWPIIDHNATDTAGRPVLSPSVNLGRLFGAAIASAIANLINTATTAPAGLSASNGPGGYMYVSAPAEGVLYNGYTVYISTTGANVTVAGSPSSTATMGGGVDPIPGPPPDPPDPDELDPLPLGTFALAHNERMLTVNQNMFNFSSLHNVFHYDNTFFEDSGQIDTSQVAEGTPELLAMADYQGDVALFGLKHVLIYHIDPDPAQNFKRQVLHRTGIVAPHALVPYGEGDVMYLSRSGIRSLRTRSGVDEAFAADLGTPIDDLVQDIVEAASAAVKLNNFFAEVEPRHGRLWMALNEQIFVLSLFPESKISAWTVYDASAHPVGMMNATTERIYWRSGNNVIVYSGEDGHTYDATEAIAQIPYIDGGKGATNKNWQGIDCAAIGNWQIRASFDPTQPAAFDLIANITKSTYAQQKIPMNGFSPSVSLELRTTMASAARLGNVTVHYTDATAD